MTNQYKVSVIVVDQVSKYFVINALTNKTHSFWDSFEGAATVVKDLNRMMNRMNRKVSKS